MKLKEFFIKVVIVSLAAVLIIMYATYSAEKAAVNFMRNEVAGIMDINRQIDDLRNRESRRIRLLGMTTFNPSVCYKVSLVKEKEGNLPGAIEEMELGLGLLNLWSSDEKLKEYYQARLDSLSATQ